MLNGKSLPKQVVIFGTGSFAEVVDFYLQRDSDLEVVAFTVTADSLKQREFLGRPVIPFEEIESCYSPTLYSMFIAMGYRQLNRLREQFFDQAKSKGYGLISYMCSRATHWGDTRIGENVFIFEDNTIQPFVSIGDDTILWSGNHIGHHSSIGPHCFISSHVVVSGHCSIRSHCFLGVNATITEGVTIGERNIIGPGTLIQKDTGPDEVYLGERTPKFPKNSSQFMR